MTTAAENALLGAARTELADLDPVAEGLDPIPELDGGKGKDETPKPEAGKPDTGKPSDKPGGGEGGEEEEVDLYPEEGAGEASTEAGEAGKGKEAEKVVIDGKEFTADQLKKAIALSEAEDVKAKATASEREAIKAMGGDPERYDREPAYREKVKAVLADLSKPEPWKPPAELAEFIKDNPAAGKFLEEQAREMQTIKGSFQEVAADAFRTKFESGMRTLADEAGIPVSDIDKAELDDIVQLVSNAMPLKKAFGLVLGKKVDAAKAARDGANNARAAGAAGEPGGRHTPPGKKGTPQVPAELSDILRHMPKEVKLRESDIARMHNNLKNPSRGYFSEVDV